MLRTLGRQSFGTPLTAAVATASLGLVALHELVGESRCEGGFKFPDSQLFKPVQPYPFWDHNWDFREETDETVLASVRRSGTNRHIILVRHGQ
jgi:ligand-binding SRPBCC domain-containing protein